VLFVFVFLEHSTRAYLLAYLDHGVLELDNNTAERAVRPVTFGRKKVT
jgi:hypothetical protein